MQTKLHLVSMPWADPELPSIQIAALKAFIDDSVGKRVTTKTYSAFAGILLEQTRRGYTNWNERLGDFEEYPYFLMYMRRFLRHKPGVRSVSIARQIDSVNAAIGAEPLTERTLSHLERRTRTYIDQTIVPQLSRRGVNVVGFTLNYYQLYASLYCAQHLRESHPEYRYIFLYGGATVIYPKVAEVLERLGVQGLCVIGEGERKLELIVRELLAASENTEAVLLERLAALHEGVYSIAQRNVNLYEPDAKALLSLQTPVETLPLPNFDEYYASLRTALHDRKLAAQFKAGTWLALEGTRGCFAHCDFCDVHTSWSGFRKSSAERVVERALELAHRHQMPRIKFMDNVCDTWAERYADIMIERGIRISAFMECRVHHPEAYWTKLSLAGVEAIQVGIEALSPTLIRSMNKGTRAKQNLLVQKWLKELGIESLSNIISHHPKSNRREVEETKHVLRLIPHLDRLDISNLALLIGSPLQNGLRADETLHLAERQPFEFPRAVDRYFVLKGEYECPDSWFDDGVFAAWDDLVEWESQFAETTRGNAFMSATRYGVDEILIRDGRYGTVVEHYLSGESARVYQLCHQGPTPVAIADGAALPLEVVDRILSSLSERRLLVELDGCYVALALRPRDELVANYVQSFRERANQPRPIAAPAQYAAGR